jgi:tRNA(fMet)-specific endonuclease VapC
MLDADVIISAERGDFFLQGWVASQMEQRFEIAAITVAELWHGVERATKAQRAGRKRYIEDILSGMPVIPYTEQTAYGHARLWAELAASGKMTGFYDLILAAAALERGNSVATFNQRHFRHIKGLTVIDPRESH